MGTRLYQMIKKAFIYIWLVTGLTVLLSGCVGLQEAQRSSASIGFNPVIGHDTRAVESVPLPLDCTFNVWAVQASSRELYIDNETISYNNGWTSTKIWPFDKLMFEAYSPSSLKPEFTPETGLTINDFDCSEGNMDILIAKRDFEFQDVDSLVTLPFEHVLSRVEFRIHQSISSQMAVKVKKIKLSGFATKGTYNSRSDIPWTVKNNEEYRVAFENEEGVEITSDVIYLGEEFYTIPQNFHARVEVEFDVRYGGATWIPQTEVLEKVEMSWEPNTHYTYTLTLTMGKMKIHPGISNMNNRV